MPQSFGVYPVLYIEYQNDIDLQNKIAFMADGNSYQIQFSHEDKKYPYLNDYDDFKKLVIECVNPLDEHQMTRIINDFKHLGQDMLRHEMGIYCYFVGPNGEDLTKNIINTYRRNIMNNKRNVQTTPVKNKAIPKDAKSQTVTVKGGSGSFEDIKFLISVMPYNENDEYQGEILTEAKPAELAGPIYASLKIPVYDRDTVGQMKAILKKKPFELKFNDELDISRSADDASAGFTYQLIKLATPLTAEQVDTLVKMSKNYGEELFIQEAMTFVTLWDSFDQLGKNVTKQILNSNLFIDFNHMNDAVAYVDNQITNKVTAR